MYNALFFFFLPDYTYQNIHLPICTSDLFLFLNRFVPTPQTQCEVVCLDSGLDYRSLAFSTSSRLQELSRTYIYPCSASTDKELDSIFATLTEDTNSGGEKAGPRDLIIKVH